MCRNKSIVGGSRTITMDKDGDGVIDEKQVITKLTDASGQVTETWTIYNGGGVKISAANDNFSGSLPGAVPHKLNKWLKTA